MPSIWFSTGARVGPSHIKKRHQSDTLKNWPTSGRAKCGLHLFPISIFLTIASEVTLTGRWPDAVPIFSCHVGYQGPGIKTISNEFVQTVCSKFGKRLKLCVESNGSHIEKLM
ncbi:unnamed protein product [Lepeophtheirus salmonis]|uniref:(salmon louse) hypothetical protein n=1 Tax=Lepeophtheirus salmonis TaxID=72036 RepID=A0A7R8CKK4_LEPSM|nr:unnamed protein product [Lepeophtheirus salmonis]CAF2846228.1 unnamed protein product [Lepeophtheirus salmonis]